MISPVSFKKRVDFSVLRIDYFLLDRKNNHTLKSYFLYEVLFIAYIFPDTLKAKMCSHCCSILISFHVQNTCSYSLLKPHIMLHEKHRRLKCQKQLLNLHSGIHINVI